MNKSGHLSNIKVLMYHRVLEEAPGEGTSWHYVLAESFRKQLKLIDDLGYTPITFYDYLLYREDKLTLPKNPIIITFDDGYLDTYEVALPILMEYGMSAVIFALGNRSLQRALWDENGQNDRCALMTDEQLQIADSLGFEIGAHSMNHLDLTTVGEAELYSEIVASKKNLETFLEKPVVTFAYPYGRINNKTRKLAIEAGYHFACGVYTGPYRFGDDLFDIRRLAINSDVNTLQYLMRLITPYQYVEWLYARTVGQGAQSNQQETIVKERLHDVEKTMF